MNLICPGMFIKIHHVLAEYISQTMKLGNSIPPYRTFTLDELKEATNNFDASTLICGSVDGQVTVVNLIYFPCSVVADLPYLS